MSRILMLDRVIESPLQRNGYIRTRPRIYAFRKNIGIKHYIYFQQHGFAKSTVTADFAFKDDKIEDFANRCARQFGNRNLDFSDIPAVDKCYMRFGFFRLLEELRPWRFNLNTNDIEQAVGDLDNLLRNKLLPLVEGTHDRKSLYERLLSDQEPCPWFAVNAAIRAAQVIGLSHLLRFSSEDLSKVLAEQTGVIAAGLSHRVATDVYLANVFKHAEQLT